MSRKRLPVLTLPKMRCDDGCGRCCGPVPVTGAEYRGIVRHMKAHGLKPMPTDESSLTCPLFDGQRCMVHAVRPLLCRVFGHTFMLTCPHGFNVNLPEAVIRDAVRSNGLAVGLLPVLLAAESWE